jgi:anti-sigma B factor antagonist
MELTQKQAPGAAIVAVHGKLVGTPQNCEAIHDVFRSLLDDGTKKIVVDLTDTPWANSQGIGMLIGAHTSVVKAGGKLVLAGPNDRISSVLAVTRLDLVFKLFPNEDAAVQYLTTSPRIDPDTRSQAVT